MKTGWVNMALVAAVGLSLSVDAFAAQRRVVVWSEGTADPNVYPRDINAAVGDALKSLKGWEVVLAGIDQPDQGVSEELLSKTDVLIWWGHKRHDQVRDEVVARIVKHVKEDGMGFISLHSSHFAKCNKALMGTACTWGAYVVDANVTLTVKDPNHPICKGVAKSFDLGLTERYSEPYAVPTPQSVPLECIYTFKDGHTEKARQGLCWTIGKGKMFYFQTGHETCRHYYDPNVQQILRNAVEWAAPQKGPSL
jgi:trehalose utilization protein